MALYEKLGVKETAHHIDVEPRSSTSRPKVIDRTELSRRRR